MMAATLAGATHLDAGIVHDAVGPFKDMLFIAFVTYLPLLSIPGSCTSVAASLNHPPFDLWICSFRPFDESESFLCGSR